MSASDENLQAITTNALDSSSCDRALSGSINEDSAVALNQTNSSTVPETLDIIADTITGSDHKDFEDQTIDDMVEDTIAKESEPLSAKEIGDDQQQDLEQASTTQERDCGEEEPVDASAPNVRKEETTEKDLEHPEPSIKDEDGDTQDDKEQRTIVSDRKETIKGDLMSQKPETKDKNSNDKDPNDKGTKDDSLEQSESKNTSEQNSDDNIEWLTPFSMPRVKEDETEETDAEKEKDGKDGALKMLKKGAVAAVGGTMVGVGLVMIPLPTPFGAVVASSGLAVLGSEFDEAKELNDKLIDGAKGHLSKARDTIVKGIENMHSSDDDSSIDSKDEVLPDDDSGDKKEADGAGPVIKVNAATLGSEIEDSEKSENDSLGEKGPVWLHMNPIERDRQAKLAKKKYKKDKQTNFEQAKEAFTKKTGKFLSDNLLPLIKKTEPSAAEDETDLTNTSTTAGKSKQISDTSITKKLSSQSMMSFLKKKSLSSDKDHSAESSTSMVASNSDGADKKAFVLSSQSMMSLFKKKTISSDKSQSTDIDSSIAASKSDGTDSDTSVTKRMLKSMSLLKKKPTSFDKSQPPEIDVSIAVSKSDGTDSDTSVTKNMFNSMSFLKKKSAPSDTSQTTERLDTSMPQSKSGGTDSATSVTKNMLSSQTMMSFLKKKPHPTTTTKSDIDDSGGNSQTMMSCLRKKTAKTVPEIDTSTAVPKSGESNTNPTVTKSEGIQTSTEVERISN